VCVCVGKRERKTERETDFFNFLFSSLPVRWPDWWLNSHPSHGPARTHDSNTLTHSHHNEVERKKICKEKKKKTIGNERKRIKQIKIFISKI
jgi:hypothetical protein